jgi:hypothetical protein
MTPFLQVREISQTGQLWKRSGHCAEKTTVSILGRPACSPILPRVQQPLPRRYSAMPRSRRTCSSSLYMAAFLERVGATATIVS